MEAFCLSIQNPVTAHLRCDRSVKTFAKLIQLSVINMSAKQRRRFGWPNCSCQVVYIQKKRSHHQWVRKRLQASSFVKTALQTKRECIWRWCQSSHSVRGFHKVNPLSHVPAGRSAAVRAHVEGELRPHSDGSRGRPSAHWAGAEAGGPAPHEVRPVLLEGLQEAQRTSLWTADIVSVTHSDFYSPVSSLFSSDASNLKKQSMSKWTIYNSLLS